MNYIPLNVISSFSLLESTITIPKLLSQAKEKGYTTIALTDKNVMHGAVEFYLEAKKQNIKPIIGITLDVHENAESDTALSVVLLAKDAEGYQALLTLSSLVKYNHKKITINMINDYSTQLIGIINYESIVKLNENSDKLILRKFKDCIDESYLGILADGENRAVIERISQVSKDMDMPLVVSEPMQALQADDALSIDVLKAINTQSTLDANEKKTQPLFYLKDKSEQIDLYSELQLSEALLNTEKIARSIQLDLSWKSVLPKYTTPEDMSSADYLVKIVRSQLETKISGYTDEYKERMDKELGVIIKMGFADYFLIIWDLMRYAHQKGIVTGAGRGSAAGSLVSYLLNITDVDPVEYDLLFDRFLNEERYTLPDIDLDFPDNKRDSILQYVLNKYGAEHVAQIATFGTFAAKMALRDTGRVLGLTPAEMKTWSDAIPGSLGITLKRAYKESEALRKLVNQNETNKKLFQIALKLEGLPRHVSTHAAGVVISKDPLIQTAPLQEGNGAMPLTQFTMNDIETVGLLKMDFLGLKNLTILADCLTNVPELKGSISDKLNQISLNDEKTLELFRAGDTNGIFQFESSGIKNVLRKLQPSSFEDIVAVNALYRPGPMEQIDVFIERKKGLTKTDYLHEDLKEILEVTNGVMVYQEQVMKVASKIAGYSLAEADILRRAISKKIRSEIDAGRQQFIAGARKKGYSEDVAGRIYEHIERFADYGFNRSHAVSYSKLAFQLAYFKVHHSAAFFVSLMRASANNKDKVTKYLLEAKQRGIELVHPDINQSDENFKVKDNKICFGFNSIKGVRKDFIQHILYVRKKQGPFKDLLSFINQIDKRWRKEQNIVPLIYSGCFDQLEYNRRTLIDSLESILNSVSMSNGNVELFESLSPKIHLSEEFSLEEVLKQEFEVTGFYLSGHPTDKYNDLRNECGAVYLTDSINNKTKTYLVSVQDIKKIQTKKGEPMAFLEVTDASGEATCVLFPDVYRKYSKDIVKKKAFLVTGKAEFKKNKWNLLVSNMKDPDKELERKSETGKMLFLRFDNLNEEQSVFTEILSILEKDKGSTEVIIYDQSTERKEKLKPKYNLNTASESLKTIKEVLGEMNVILK